MDSQAFIEMCIEDVDKKITGLPDLGDFEAHCWEQVWPTSAKGFSTYGKDALTTSMSCAIVFDEISFVYHDDFAYCCKTNRQFRNILKKRDLPGLIETKEAKLTLLQYRAHPFKTLEDPNKSKEKNKPIKKLGSALVKKVQQSKEAKPPKAKGVISVSVRVNKDKAKAAYEAEKKTNNELYKSGMTFEQWLDHQKWLALRERMNKL